MKLRLIISGLVSLGMLLATFSVQGATPSPSMLSNACAGCHGLNGVSVGPASPSIAGIAKEYFVDSMMEYRDGSRPSTIMTRIAKGYSKEEIERMAEFFSNQKFVPKKQSFDPKLAKEGEKIHKEYCEKCHEEGGAVSEDASVLAGQWAPYLRFAMEDFISGKRHMPKKMKQKVQKLREKEGDACVDKLVNFYASKTGGQSDD